jgi:hypothetical protein
MSMPRSGEHENTKLEPHLDAVLTPKTGQIRTWGPGERRARPRSAALPPLPRLQVSRSSLNNPPSDDEDMTYGASLARVNANTDRTRNQNQHKQEHSDTTAASEPAKRGLSISNAARRFLRAVKAVLFSSVINVLLVFVPVGIAVRKFSTPLFSPASWVVQLTSLADFTQMPAGVIFAMNAIAIVPLAGLLSYATQSVASRLGDTVGALMNVTFGNAVELIILM